MKAASTIHSIFKDATAPMTLREIQDKVESLKASEVSMALCYLMRMRYLTRELTENISKGRKRVWLYTYHSTRLPKEAK